MQNSRPKNSPRLRCSASSGAIPHQPVASRTSDMIVRNAWLVRGARASMTSVSFHGSAFRCMSQVSHQQPHPLLCEHRRVARTHDIAVFGGDGIGPEITEATLVVLDA